MGGKIRPHEHLQCTHYDMVASLALDLRLGTQPIPQLKPASRVVLEALSVRNLRFLRVGRGALALAS